MCTQKITVWCSMFRKKNKHFGARKHIELCDSIHFSNRFISGYKSLSLHSSKLLPLLLFWRHLLCRPFQSEFSCVFFFCSFQSFCVHSRSMSTIIWTCFVSDQTCNLMAIDDCWNGLSPIRQNATIKQSIWFRALILLIS